VILRIAGPPFLLPGKAVNGVKSRDAGRPLQDRCMGRIVRDCYGTERESWKRRSPCGCGVSAVWADFLDGDHGERAAGAAGRGLWTRGRFRRRGLASELEAEHQAREGECLALGGMVQSEVADLDEALGQDMLEEAAEELGRVECAGALALLLAVAVAEADGVIIGLGDGGVGEGDAVEVAGEIAQRLVAGADGLGVDNPV